MSKPLEIIKIEDSLKLIDRPNNIIQQTPVYILSQSSLVLYSNIDISN